MRIFQLLALIVCVSLIVLYCSDDVLCEQTKFGLKQDHQVCALKNLVDNTRLSEKLEEVDQHKKLDFRMTFQVLFSGLVVIRGFVIFLGMLKEACHGTTNNSSSS